MSSSSSSSSSSFVVTETEIESTSEPFGPEWRPHVSRSGGEVQHYLRNEDTQALAPLDMYYFVPIFSHIKYRVERGFSSMSKDQMFKKTMVNFIIYLNLLYF